MKVNFVYLMKWDFMNHVFVGKMHSYVFPT